MLGIDVREGRGMALVLAAEGSTVLDPVLSVVGAIPFDAVGLGTLVTFMVISLIRGWVVPRSVMEDRMADKDRQIAAAEKERDAWHKAHDLSEAGRAELKTQNGELIQSTGIANRFMEAARTYFERASQGREIEKG